jgi:hypothetical protein
VSGIEDLSREDLLKIMARDRFVKDQLAQRLNALTVENVELVGILNEIERELAEARKEHEPPGE